MSIFDKLTKAATLLKEAGSEAIDNTIDLIPKETKEITLTHEEVVAILAGKDVVLNNGIKVTMVALEE